MDDKKRVFGLKVDDFVSKPTISVGETTIIAFSSRPGGYRPFRLSVMVDHGILAPPMYGENIVSEMGIDWILAREIYVKGQPPMDLASEVIGFELWIFDAYTSEILTFRFYSPWAVGIIQKQGRDLEGPEFFLCEAEWTFDSTDLAVHVQIRNLTFLERSHLPKNAAVGTVEFHLTPRSKLEEEGE